MYKKLVFLTALAFLIMLGLSQSGCRQYDKPEYQTIENNESAYLIYLEDPNLQGDFKSIEYLESREVASKRVRIPHRWYQTGYRYWQGQWIPDAVLIRVDRTPVTRRWTESPKFGTSVCDDSLQAESRDSVGFTVRVNCVGLIKEEDTSLFLFHYPNNTLAQVMDNEVRAKAQQLMFEGACQADLNELRSKIGLIMALIENGRSVLWMFTADPNELASAPLAQTTSVAANIRALSHSQVFGLGLSDFFKKRGITIQSISMEGGFQYDNPEVQKSIDDTFLAQNKVMEEKAKYEAELKEYDRIKSEANQLKSNAETEAEGAASAITKVTDAAAEMGSDSIYYVLESLKVDGLWLERWNGIMPEVYVTSGNSGQK